MTLLLQPLHFSLAQLEPTKKRVWLFYSRPRVILGPKKNLQGFYCLQKSLTPSRLLLLQVSSDSRVLQLCLWIDASLQKFILLPFLGCLESVQKTADAMAVPQLLCLGSRGLLPRLALHGPTPMLLLKNEVAIKPHLFLLLHPVVEAGTPLSYQ